ncbi:BEL1-like homeodomain protein 9 [Cicer arietinum]|uniref:BEL1-like homeodomain protein 9 n=1 Tax=Cicer arietinum TaxID=3827 RepID=A0A1S2Z5Z7_CICAR|nr:BEL1-like homeodomain protein 9 [Cicer arietinum]
MAEEGFEHYHIPQQSRREKLRILSQNQTNFVESSSNSLHPNSLPLPSLYDPSLISSNFMMGFGGVVNSSSSQLNSPIDPFVYQAQNLREFNHGYTNEGGSSSNSEVMLLKSEPLSLSLSSNKNNQNQVNFQRFGSVIYGGGCEVSRNTVPLGPFTGYASILKGSRFLKPAQQLLDEICDVGVSGICGEKIAVDDSLMDSNGQDSGIVNGVDDGNEGRKNKSRLLTMLDEVCRRYRQYYQQIHAVITSFEYVSGLGNAAPYASLALNAMSKHFRCLKNVITDQLRFISKSNFQISNSRKDESPRFRNSDAAPYSQRPGFLEHVQPPVWRPQRGLPERAVSVLRAWLFEHFLHPYPTDTDKIMLAKQTGLSRNQVSNWFINARVRLWKPMVEEIHMLESQQTQKEPQRDENLSTSTDKFQLPSNNIIAQNPCNSTDKFQSVAYKRTRNELSNMSVLNQQVGSNGVSMGNNVATSNNGVSLTLGLHQNHGIGLSEPFNMSAAQRFGLALQTDSYVTSNFQSQNRQFGRDLIGGQLLHDFVG